MDIQEEIKAAHLAYLQDQWDKWLLNGWRTSNAITRFAVEAFVKKHKMLYEDFYNLRRVPLHGIQQKTRLSRFIAAYLPRLNTLLWADGLTDDQILMAMKKFDTQNQPADQAKVKRETAERKQAINDAYAETVSHRLVREQREYTAKSNWGHCK